MFVRDGTKYGGPGLSECYRPSEADPVVEVVVGKVSSRPDYMTVSQCRRRLDQVLGLLEWHSNEFDEDQLTFLRTEADHLKKALKL